MGGHFARAVALTCASILLAVGCAGPGSSTTPTQKSQPTSTIPPATTIAPTQIPSIAPLATTIPASTPTASAPSAAGHALRFFGTGRDQVDRVKIRLDDPATDLPGPPADTGATDFTIEWWMRADPGENLAPPVECGQGNVNWIFGNIVFDRDRYNQDRKFGISLVGGRVVFGVSGDGSGDATLCGDVVVDDGQWHHVAVQRRRADGRLWIFVDGRLDAEGAGPTGNVSYPDNGRPLDFCGGPCLDSDPFLVIGAEKHDAGPEFPSYSGWIDEVRLSSVLRYAGDFSRPTEPFKPDVDTAALWHFDEGEGTLVHDMAAGAASPGEVHVGGPNQGPRWVISDAPLTAP